MRERLRADEQFQTYKAGHDAATTDAARTDFNNKMLKRASEISNEVGVPPHMQAAPTARARKAGDEVEKGVIQDEMNRDSNKLGLTPDQKLKIETYRRNTQALGAHTDYNPLRKITPRDAGVKAAITRLEANIARGTMIVAEVHDRNEQRLKKGDDMLAGLNDDTAATEAKSPRLADANNKPSETPKQMAQSKSENFMEGER